ncbi:hypothetical protein GH714_041011 [Hevea brasiliensis]|uniref:non-specific serine/threonine protein kinase n=1 Tax=Hevea brasiliensis TaxID=3981 RepID=A0A6A6NA31_HEVBR|nr:hypothetical protein GH714_041011 [Hevea brasiliensis]
MLSLVGLAVWCFRKRRKEALGHNGGYVMPSPLGSSLDQCVFAVKEIVDEKFEGEGRPVLDWATRVKIAVGAARGIAYLHEDCHPRVIHRDIKSSNILLDNNFEAKVSDFGLAKLALDANTHVTTRVMGTFGYMAPEYASSGKLTEKSDVFSYGVVLLELITGRKPVDASQPLGDESLVEWARPLLGHALANEEFDSLVDPRLEKNYNESEMFRMIEAAAACVRHSAAKRPRMGQVVRAFDSLAAADLSNGMRVGESEVFNSAEQSAEIRLFRRMAFGSQNYIMEDWNMLAADCVVISCCCQCLILQIIIFILLKLPCKLIRKTKEYTKKKLRTRDKKQAEKRTESVKSRFQDEFVEFHEGSITIQIEELHRGYGFESCMEEVERVLGDFSQKGEFAFGSFWAMMATLQSDQLKQLKDIFMRFDMDSDGSLTQLELAALLRSLGLKPSGDQIHVLLSNMDANGNGYVEFDELVTAILPDMNEEVLINQEQLLEVFRSFDRDGNGYITAAELAGSMAKMGHPLTYKTISDDEGG